MKFTPEKIWQEFETDNISLLTATELLLSIIENSNESEIRVNAISTLAKIISGGDKMYKILENLVVSEENVKVRMIAINYIGKLFLYRALPLLRWAIKHESDYNCQIEIVKLLGSINVEESKILLYKEIQKFIKKRYINKDRKIENRKFKNVLRILLKEKNFEDFTHNELAKILINILVISQLFTQYNNIYYELNRQNGLIEKLDLSDMEYEVKGTPSGWKNNIKSLSEIPGINFLNSLRYLDLSNNEIINIRELISLPNLTHLILKNNKLSRKENLDYFKDLVHLELLDLRGNEIVKYVHKNNFNPHVRILLRDRDKEIK